MSLSEDALRNREVWTKTNAEYTDRQAQEAWGSTEIEWGTYGVPERELHVLDDVSGQDVIELGCGTAYFSAWLARRGARPVGLDVTPAQLETARRMMSETGIEFPLVEASAEDVPLPDESFDLALSEYGASPSSRDRLRARGAVGATRARGCKGSRVLRLRPGRLGSPVAGGGDLEGAEALTLR